MEYSVKSCELRNKIPADYGFRMPGEYEAHEACLMIWPQRPGSWKDGKSAGKAFAEVATAIAKSERVYMLVDFKNMPAAANVIKEIAGEQASYITLVPGESDDSWARDCGPTFVINSDQRRGIVWKFNAWGGDYDGLYKNYEKDARVAAGFCRYLGEDFFDEAADGFVLEGGSIHVDGEGTLLTTQECLLSPGRNPGMTREEIEKKLCGMLGVQKVIWLPYGIYNDETNGHIDNMCCFSAPGEVLLAWTDDRDDPQYERSRAALEILENTTDAKGRKLKIRLLPIPEHPICISPEDLEGYIFEEGEDTREVGERLAASYVNFYISNSAIVYPLFGGENSESDRRAENVLRDAFPNREIVGIYARDILLGGGNIHCITQQIPSPTGKVPER